MTDTLDDNPGGATRWPLSMMEKFLRGLPVLSMADCDQVLASLRDGKTVLLHLKERPQDECYLLLATVAEGLYGARLLPHEAGQEVMRINKILWARYPDGEDSGTSGLPPRPPSNRR